MANYLEQYQYQPIAPANTNIEQIAKTFQTKVAYWSQGASQVKTAYQNYLGLDLSRTDNQQALSDYMKDAKTKLQSLTMTDLSIGENVGKSLDVFDPITKDRNIMGDHALTTKLTESIRRGEATANIDGGKDYSSKNVQYLRNKLNDFTHDKNRESWAGYMASGTEYTPYTDASKWMMDAMKEFAPSEYLQQWSDGNGYIKTEEIMSHLPNDIRRYLMATMPDKVRRQLQIDGAVDFYGREDILEISYKDDFNNLVKANTARIKEIDLLSINATKEKQDELTKEKEALTTEINQSTEMLKNIAEDPEYVKKNRDMFAGNTAIKQYVNAAATGLAHEVKKYRSAPDMIWLGKQRMLMEQRENALDRDSRWDIAVLNSQTTLAAAALRGGGKKDANGKMVSPIYDPDAIPEDITLKEANIGEEVQIFNTTRNEALSAANEFVNSLTVGQRDVYNNLNEEEKLKFFDEHFKDKTNAFNQAENEIAARMKEAKAAGKVVSETALRDIVYNEKGLTPFIKYREALENFTHAKEAKDKEDAYKDNAIFSKLPNQVTFDIAWGGNMTIPKESYIKIMNGTFDGMRITQYNPDTKTYSAIPREKLKAIMNTYRDLMRNRPGKEDLSEEGREGNELMKALVMNGIRVAGKSDFQIKDSKGQWRTIDVSDNKQGVGLPYQREHKARFVPKAPEHRTIQAFPITDQDEVKRLSASHNKSVETGEGKELKANPYTSFYRDSEGNVYGKRLTINKDGTRVNEIDREHILESNKDYRFDPEEGLNNNFKNIKRTVELQAQESNYTHTIVYNNPITSAKKHSYMLTYERKPDGGAPTYTLYKYAMSPEEKQKAKRGGDLNGHYQFNTYKSIYEVQQALTKN